MNAHFNIHFSASRFKLYCCFAKTDVCDEKCLMQLSCLLQKEAEEDTLSSKKVKELSVIDGRRAQNCNILLSRWVILLALAVSLTYDSMSPEPSGFQTWGHILYCKTHTWFDCMVPWKHLASAVLFPVEEWLVCQFLYWYRVIVFIYLFLASS